MFVVDTQCGRRRRGTSDHRTGEFLPPISHRQRMRKECQNCSHPHHSHLYPHHHPSQHQQRLRTQRSCKRIISRLMISDSNIYCFCSQNIMSHYNYFVPIKNDFVVFFKSNIFVVQRILRNGSTSFAPRTGVPKNGWHQPNILWHSFFKIWSSPCLIIFWFKNLYSDARVPSYNKK